MNVYDIIDDMLETLDAAEEVSLEELKAAATLKSGMLSRGHDLASFAWCTFPSLQPCARVAAIIKWGQGQLDAHNQWVSTVRKKNWCLASPEADDLYRRTVQQLRADRRAALYAQLGVERDAEDAEVRRHRNILKDAQGPRMFVETDRVYYAKHLSAAEVLDRVYRGAHCLLAEKYSSTVVADTFDYDGGPDFETHTHTRGRGTVRDVLLRVRDCIRDI